jgi:hypothetical protein
VAGTAYSPIGEVMDRIARERHIRGPYNVGRYVQEKMGEGPSGSAWSEYFRGESRPKPTVLELFRDAFSLTEKEEDELARAYAFPEPSELAA